MRRVPLRPFVSLACAFTVMVSFAACNEASPPPAAKGKAAAKAPTRPAAKPAPEPAAKPAPEPAKPPVAKKEIVFDPRRPPAGYVNCHRNHCHKVGGGVASYQQVMAEIGATKIIGVPKMKPIPPAPADVAAPPADAKKTGSGLAFKILREGSGTERPGPDSVVSVHYTGWTAAGKGFDSSVSRGQPATIPLNRVFPGWSEAMQLMRVGEERRLWIPQNLVMQGRPGLPPGMLVFDVELLAIR